MTSPLVLASASPRRLDLLRRCGIEPAYVIETDVDESVLPRELPRAYAQRVARAKAEAGAASNQAAAAYVLAADTVVACGRRILPKALDETTAAECLDLLSGRRHRVMTAIVVATPDRRFVGRLVETAVRFKRLSPQERSTYLSSAEWHGKAGGYAIQGAAEAFVPAIQGSYSNVVGLPLCETLGLLQGLGWRPA
ncbi:MAG TPA: Maf family nucleotide pyrophosphatase [Geminicoccus sp.]|jgi:septum formation protein|uniref:Maf family protein n=1 Tax=Geminicoccus sp. TaxID=2024832 RepID=UPI002E324CB5|nr:Maf family nucleotide pyrophosphatase [Geminicoccus sp.]HEX2527464.1 Maf family nucleotide pyrophosphatase [Geminicoccus sp.]